MRPLDGQVALVAGATRGAGRGIARMLGAAGAVVYCTGRSVRGKPATKGRTETIEETAELVTAEGGEGRWVRVDHTVASEVEALFVRVRDEAGRLDVLVNDVWGGDELTDWTPFWKHSLPDGLLLLERAITAHLITSRYGTPLLVERKSGLIVEITDGDHYGYRGALYYDFAKNGAIRLAYGMAEDLKTTGVTAVAVTPGYLRSEAMLDHYGVTEKNWRDGVKKDPHFAWSETPCFVGRALAALAADPEVGRKSGRVFASWTLAREYGFDDIDGRRPDWGQHFDDVVRELLARGGPFDAVERMFLDQRREQARFEPRYEADGARIAEVLAATGA